MQDSLPQHIAFIPDGNRRWAKETGVSVKEGHEKGVDMFNVIVRHAVNRGINVISLWGMSLDNFSKRSPIEIKNLLDLFQKEFEALLHDEDIHSRQIRVRVFGRWEERFPPKLKRAIHAVQDATKEYTNCALNFFLAYNGTDEMQQAVQQIVASGITTITPEVVKAHLYTKDLPPVDFLIRTGGDPHLSAGFMMWDIANAELYFTNTLWPAFDTDKFDEALEDFATRRRMRGK